MAMTGGVSPLALASVLRVPLSSPDSLRVSQGNRLRCPCRQATCSRLFPWWSVKFLISVASRPSREAL